MDADATVVAARFALQLGVVLLAAKVGAEVFERWLGQPAVLGELLAGVAIGPFALGGITWPVVGLLFQDGTPSSLPVPMPLWVFAEMAAVLLLFTAGLETDFGSFVRFGPRALGVAVGGVVLPFVLGDVATVAVGMAPGFFSTEALFVGAALTATSVGVTARVLGDLGALDTPEGVTILGAAVFDDVLGILVLAVVVSLAHGESVSPLSVGLLGLRAVGTWVVLTGGLVLGATGIAQLLLSFRSPGASLALAIGLALVCGFIAQDAGLAMIVGAFSAGIALSRTALRQRLHQEVRAVYHAFVPAFFVVVGMLVDIRQLPPVLAFGIGLAALAVAGKLVGCGVTALALGFRPIGALRVGIGMIPRGEVALIIAGVGLASGAIDSSVYGVVIFMTFATTVAAPPLLLPAFRHGGPGFATPRFVEAPVRAVIELPDGLLQHFEAALLQSFREQGYRLAGEWTEPNDTVGRELRRRDELVTLRTVSPYGLDRHIEVESESRPRDWQALLARAAAAAAAESAASFDRIVSQASRPTPESNGGLARNDTGSSKGASPDDREMR